MLAVAVLGKTFAPFPRRSILLIITPHRECSRIAKGFKMHWLQMFLMGWLSVGIAIVGFLFWLCQRTASNLNDPVKLASLPPQRAELGASNLSGELRSA
jgi:hypothetical protein